MRCTACGFVSNKEEKVCSRCGAELRAADKKTLSFAPVEVEEKEEAIEIKPQEEPTLVVARGPVIGQRFLLTKKEFTVGRDPRSDIFLDDITVSRKHAKINLTKDKVVISDDNSLNGTYLNSERVEKAVLKHGDELQIGKFKLVFLTKET